jgi:hypothetical protein
MSKMVEIGDKFGYCQVLEFSHYKYKKPFYKCLCNCGNIFSTDKYSLLNGVTKSCGCGIVHYTHGMSKTKIYRIWVSMKERCYNKTNKRYPDYGGRGINICNRWLYSFENFLEDMGEHPENMTLERIDNNKGYELNNCKWATPKEQASNRRNNVYLTYQGQTKLLKTWAKEFHLKEQTLRKRISRKWSTKRALET